MKLANLFRSKEPILTPLEFTQKCVDKFRKAPNVRNVDIVKESHLKLTSKDSKTADVFLDNSYTTYKQEPQLIRSIIDNLVQSLCESVFNEEKVNPDKIIPIIRHRSSLDYGKYLYDEYNDELIICYGEDLPKSIQYLTEAALKNTAYAKESIKEIAHKNLDSFFNKVEIHGEDGFYMVSAGGCFETSLLLFGKFWDKKTLNVNGDFVIGVPNRDILLVTGNNDEIGINKARSLIQKSVKESWSYPVSSKLFIYRNGKFEIYE